MNTRIIEMLANEANDPFGNPEWIVNVKENVVELQTKDGWWIADYTYNGCVNLRTAHNTAYYDKNGVQIANEDNDDDYIHICSIEGFLKLIQKLHDVLKLPENNKHVL